MTKPAHFLISSLLLLPSALPAAGEAERGVLVCGTGIGM